MSCGGGNTTIRVTCPPRSAHSKSFFLHLVRVTRYVSLHAHEAMSSSYSSSFCKILILLLHVVKCFKFGMTGRTSNHNLLQTDLFSLNTTLRQHLHTAGNQTHKHFLIRGQVHNLFLHNSTDGRVRGGKHFVSVQLLQGRGGRWTVFWLSPLIDHLCLCSEQHDENSSSSHEVSRACPPPPLHLHVHESGARSVETDQVLI